MPYRGRKLAAWPCNHAPAAAASKGPAPWASNDPMMPASTSPVPAVASRASPLFTTCTSPSGAATWADELTDTDRFGSVVLGPGLGRTPEALAEVVKALARVERPVVLDGDALAALAARPDAVRKRAAPTVLTPHDGEYERLMGRRPAADRFDEARALAQEFRSVVLLKGPATIVAEPNGAVQVVNNGDARLATAGTGDVLAGIIGALLAQGTAPFEAAVAGAWLHGHAASLRPRYGMVASDVLDVLPEALHETHMG